MLQNAPKNQINKIYNDRLIVPVKFKHTFHRSFLLLFLNHKFLSLDMFVFFLFYKVSSSL